ncbi:transcription factor with ap2 domain related protein [Cyclospora cayetanensis]|uniref:Transcription factor with ap2 domain related protein n=1 Tax=Cyclospora cayetanensis TaxID=88456 RepID=A0A1D3CT37_9EIME|nr:transcription factor with ap2 domain related protein [Cyclospora cayetanensis]
MRLKTLSCSCFGRDGAKLLTGAFVARWEATGRRVADRTMRSRLALMDLPEDTEQLPSYGRKRTDDARGGTLSPGGALESGNAEDGVSYMQECGGFARLRALLNMKETSTRGGSLAELRSASSCGTEDLSGPSPTCTLTSSCSSVSARSPASPEQCSREGIEALWGAGSLGGVHGGSSPGATREEGTRKPPATLKQPRPLTALSRELLGSPSAAGSTKQGSPAAAAANDSKASNGGLLELSLNAEILQSLLGMGGSPGAPPRDSHPAGSDAAGKGTARAGAPWGLLAPATPVTPTTSTARLGSLQGGVEGDLLQQKQKKLQHTTTLPLDLLQQLGQGLPLFEEEQQQDQPKASAQKKLVTAAQVVKLQHECSTEELTKLFEEDPCKQEAEASRKVEGSSSLLEESAHCVDTEEGTGAAADLLGEFLFKASRGSETGDLNRGNAEEFLRFGRL